MNAHHTSAPEVTIKSKQQGGNDFYLIVSAEVRLDGKVYTVRINDLVPASKSFEEIQERDSGKIEPGTPLWAKLVKLVRDKVATEFLGDFFPHPATPPNPS